MEIRVWVTTEFSAFHRWKDAPEGVAFLRDFHRHLFKVRLEVIADHDNRAVEFLTLKRQVNEYVKDRYEDQQFEMSCEQIALDLMQRFEAASVEVSEDGENGATISTPRPNESIIRERCYVGRQCEGPLQGPFFLFVPGSISPPVLKKSIKTKEKEIYGIHYGAGNNRELRLDTLLMLLKNWTGPLIVELDDSVKPEVVDAIVEFRTSEASDRVMFVGYNFHRTTLDWVKMTNKNHVYWLEVSKEERVISTAIDHPLYASDEEIT